MEEFPKEFVWFELMALHEPSPNGLRAVIAESIARRGDPVTVGPISGAYPMTVGPDSRVFEIIWQHTAAYSVINESFYTPSDANESLSTGALREYTRSRYLDYLRTETVAELVHGPLRHWFLGCQMHCIDVAAWEPPIVRRLEGFNFAPSPAPRPEC